MKFVLVLLLIFSIEFAFAENLTVEDAQLALDESLTTINQLEAEGFATDYAHDVYNEAFLVFQQAEYAEILKNNSLPDSDSSKIEARRKLSLVYWKNISYDNILLFTEDIKQYKEESYYLFDSINSLNQKISDYTNQGINLSETIKILTSANNSFYNGQFKDSSELVNQTKIQLEKDLEKFSSTNALTESTKKFLYKYFYWIISAIILVVVLIYFSIKKIRQQLLEKKIQQMETEEKVLDKLIKKTQEERFNKNKLSDIVYNLRMKKYRERLDDLKQELPILKKRLR